MFQKNPFFKKNLTSVAKPSQFTTVNLNLRGYNYEFKY